METPVLETKSFALMPLLDVARVNAEGCNDLVPCNP